MILNLKVHPNQPPGQEKGAPIPGQGDQGLETGQIEDSPYLSYIVDEVKTTEKILSFLDVKNGLTHHAKRLDQNP